VNDIVACALDAYENEAESPTVATLAKLAKALDVEVRDLFTFPERGSRDRALDLLSSAKPDLVRRVLRVLAADSDEP
jgi:transcriptional regulator with XRE-family HTH domain